MQRWLVGAYGWSESSALDGGVPNRRSAARNSGDLIRANFSSRVQISSRLAGSSAGDSGEAVDREGVASTVAIGCCDIVWTKVIRAIAA